jgi:hypothetical protein
VVEHVEPVNRAIAGTDPGDREVVVAGDLPSVVDAVVHFE